MQINLAHNSNVHYVDSTAMPICSSAHRYSVTVDGGNGGIGKTMNGWFYGFKLHLIINHNMEIVSAKFTNGSTSDIKAFDQKFVRNIKGFLVGNKGYISGKKQQLLASQGIILLTKPRKNMKKIPATPLCIALLKSRQKIESVFSTLKHNLALINKHARSLTGFFTQALAALVSYCIRKGSLKIDAINYLMTKAIS